MHAEDGNSQKHFYGCFRGLGSRGVGWLVIKLIKRPFSTGREGWPNVSGMSEEG